MEIPAEAPTLPGFDPDAVDRGDSGLRAAAVATLQALKDAGLLQERHALHSQLLIALAARAGIGLQAGKTTIATTNLVRLVVDLLNELPTQDHGVADAAAEFLAALNDAETTATK